MWSFHLIETLTQDLRYGVRMMFKSPGFTAVAVLSLALGIGANAAIFSLVNTILLRPLPVAKPEQLISIYPARKENSSEVGIWSYPNYKDFRDKNEVLRGMAVYRFAAISLSHEGTNERVWGYLVSGNYFDLLGVSAVQGRTFSVDEDRTQNSNPVVVISYNCWQNRFGSDPEVVGRSVLINGHSFTIIGVAPKEFLGTELIFSAEFWVPSMMQPWIEPVTNGLENRGDGQWFAIGRLKPGVAAAEAEANLKTVAAQLGQEYPKTNEGVTINISPPGLIFPGFRRPVLAFTGVLLLTVGLVLLIACTNLANLLLARATQRRKEIAVRLSLGASRLRLIRQMLTESVLLSITGGIVGILLGLWLIDLVKTQGLALPIDFSLLIDLRMDWRVLFFAFSLAFITGIAFGLIPALQATKLNLVTAIKDEPILMGYRRSFLRNGLVVVQITLSFVLLITAGLIVRSLQRVQMAGPGFNIEKALALSTDVALQGYDEAKGEEFYRKILENTKALPGVRSVGLASTMPLSLDISSTGVAIEGQPQVQGARIPEALYNSISSNYFATMGISFVAGRDFTEQDRKGSTKVVIVNETFARRFWPGQDAVGKRFYAGGSDGSLCEVIGIVKDGKYFSIGEDPTSFIYFSIYQSYASPVTLVVRTDGDMGAAVAAIRNEVRLLDPNLPIYGVHTLSEHMRLSLFPIRTGATVIGGFGLLALILAALGIYGVMAYSVSRRTREIGIRMALGAQAGDMLKLVMRQGMVLALIGIAFGLAAAFAVTRVMTSILYQVSATDPVTFVIIPFLLTGVVLAACYIPARRATKVNPVIALRYE
jgi:predicted permease